MPITDSHVLVTGGGGFVGFGDGAVAGDPLAGADDDHVAAAVARVSLIADRTLAGQHAGFLLHTVGWSGSGT